MNHKVPIDDWWLGKDHQLVVSIIQWQGRWRFDARIWSRDEDGAMRPSNKGVGIGLKHLARFTDAVAKALRGARLRDLPDARPSEEFEQAEAVDMDNRE